MRKKEKGMRRNEGLLVLDTFETSAPLKHRRLKALLKGPTVTAGEDGAWGNPALKPLSHHFKENVNKFECKHFKVAPDGHRTLWCT